MSKNLNGLVGGYGFMQNKLVGYEFAFSDTIRNGLGTG